MKEKPMLLRKDKLMYLRQDGKPFGAVVRTEDGRIGWSLCCPRDQFRKKLARRIALGRAESSIDARETHSDLIWRLQEINEAMEHSQRPLQVSKLAAVVTGIETLEDYAARADKKEGA